MRLPTLTPGQDRIEAARQLHERMWAAFQRGVRVTLELKEGYRIHGALHQFWTQRGYLLRTRRVDGEKDMLELWLVPRVRREQVA